MSQFNDLSSPLRFLETRRSGKPRDMIAPGPDANELNRILTIAARVPDHGKVAPWRFMVVPPERRGALNAVLDAAYLEEKPGAGRLELEANAQFAQQAPTLVIVFTKVDPARSIPAEEQIASAACAAMQMENAANASGYVSGWLTGWAAYSDAVHRRLAQPGERIAGFIFMGTPGKPLEERPRPDMTEIVRTWDGTAAQ
ncbi:nitroreductase family protein [Pacificimonas flava]|nr:nitroreductase [Pacificimonas flava]MBB5278876.1 nitroreductase [Pacificimonas flava]